MGNIIQKLRHKGFKVRVTHMRKVKFGEKFGITSRSQWEQEQQEAKSLIQDTYPELLPAMSKKWGDVVQQKGGLTMIELETPEGVKLSASSDCSKKDHFCRKEGLSLALERLLAHPYGEKDLGSLVTND